jgi:hypothetical protein
MTRTLCRLAALVLAATAAGSLGGVAEAGDATVFVAIASPREDWKTGYGASLSSTWFKVLNFEAEAARTPAEEVGGTMTAFTGSALLAPTVGILIPYGGLGVGVFRQTLGGDSDTGTLKCLVLGAKLKLGPLLIVKGEFRRFDLSGEPLLAMDKRVSVGAGLSF